MATNLVMDVMKVGLCEVNTSCGQGEKELSEHRAVARPHNITTTTSIASPPSPICHWTMSQYLCGRNGE